MKNFRAAAIAAAILVVFTAGIALADTQTNPGTTAADNASTGTFAWTTVGIPGNVVLFDGTSTTLTSHYLALTGFGFSLPPSAVVNGIEVSLMRSSIVSGGTLADHSVVIVKNAVPGSDEHASLTNWPSVSTAAAYGSPSDLWGQGWTPTDINSAGFGVAVSVTGTNTTTLLDVATIQSVSITVSYYVPCPSTLDTTGCDASFLKAALTVDERSAGKEKLLASLGSGGALDQSAIGNLTADSDVILSLCIYNGSNGLVGTLLVDAAGATCDTKPCWKSSGGDYPDGKGFGYKDKPASRHGVSSMKLSGGAAGKSKAKLKATGAGTLPLGIAAALDGASFASIQIRDNNVPSLCLSATVTTVSDNAGGVFKAKK